LVYKKYITRGGKKFGPYYFKSVRTPNGKVKSVYLGTKNPEGKKFSFVTFSIVVALLFVFGFLGMFAYQGFNVAEVSTSLVGEGVKESVSGDIEVVSDVDKQEDSVEGVLDGPNLKPEAVGGVEEEWTEEDIDEIIPVDETAVGISDEVDTSEPSLTASNKFEPEKEEISLDVNESEFVEEISLINLGVIINKPVVWEKRIKLKRKLDLFDLTLPDGTFNIEYYEIEDGEEILIKEKNKKTEEDNLITGNIVFNFFEDIFRTTGEAVYDSKNNKVSIKRPSKEFLIRYSTPGPIAKESVVSDWKKKIFVEGENFEDVLVYSYLDNVPAESINLYLVDKKERVKEKFVSEDLDEDGLIDYITWEIDEINGLKEYEIEIEILNVQSYPMLGGNWTVRFNTTGVANLSISVFNGTTWDIEKGDFDLQFLDLRCGENSVDYTLNSGEVFVENYSCERTGFEISKVLTQKKHYLKFEFGDQVAYAYNDVLSCGQAISGYVLMENDITGCTGNGLDLGDNTVLDCNNHLIDGDAVDDGTYGIWAAYNDHNISVKNCIIQQFSNGIFSNGNDNQFINNTIKEVYDFGIYIYISENATVVNNSFHTFQASGDRKAIRLRGANFSLVDNNNLTGTHSTGIGITTESSMAPHVTNTNISNNVINEFDYGIAGYSDDFIGNNRVENNTIFDADLYGIYFGNVNDTLVYNNDVYSTDATQDSGIGFVGTTTRINVTSNRVSNHSGSSQDGIIISSSTNGGVVIEDNILHKNFYGIYLNGADWVNVTRNDVRNSTEVGIIVYGSGAHNNRFLNNTVSYNFNDGGTEYSFYVRDSDNNSFINNSANFSIGYGFYANNADNTNVTNFYSLGSATGNLYFTNSNNASLDNVNASGGTYPLYLNTGADNLSVKNSYFDGSYGMLWVNADYTDVTNVVAKGGASQDLRFAGSTADNYVTFLNVSYNDVNWGSDPTYIITRWFLDVKVNDSDGGDIEGANVSATYDDKGPVQVFDEETDATGWIPKQNLTEKNVNTSGSYNYFTNYTVNVSHIEYGTDVQDVNLTDNVVHVVTFTDLNTAPNDPSPAIDSLDGTNTTDQDLNCSDSISDPDSDDLNVTVRWYKNNNLHLEFNDDNSGSLYSSGADYVTLLGSVNTTEGSKWFCSMVLFDGTVNSSWGNSSNLTVKNNPNTYYVSKGGNDANDGSSWYDSWLTLEHADDTAAANSLIYVGDGRYLEDSDAAGYLYLSTNRANRTFISYNKTKAIILAADDSASRVVRVEDDGNNVTLVGFTIDGNRTKSGFNGIDAGGWRKLINNTIINCTSGVVPSSVNKWYVEGNTFDSCITGINAAGSSANNLTIINNTFMGNMTTGGIIIDRPAAEMNDIIMTGNMIHNISTGGNYGPVYFNKVKADTWVFENNIFGTPEIPQEEFSIRMRNTTGLTIENNTFWAGNFSAKYAAIWVESGGNNSKLRVINNRMGNSTNYVNLEGGYFFRGTNVSALLFENNSLYQYNSTGIDIRGGTNGQTEDVIIRNNTLQYNYCEYNYGIKVGPDNIAGGKGTIKNTIIENNSIILPRLPCNQHSLFTGKTNNSKIRNNIVKGGGYGILSKHDSNYYAYNNIIANQTIFYGFVTRSGHNISFHNNTIYANHWNNTNSPAAFQMKNDNSPERNVTNVTSYDNIFYLFNTSYAYKVGENGINFANINFTSWNNTFWVNQSSQDLANDGAVEYSFTEFRESFEGVETDESIFSVWNEIPALSNVNNVSAFTSVLVNWTTQESANTSVNYGTSASLGTLGGKNNSFVIYHSVNITGLDEGTPYYYNITSCDFESNCNDTGTFNFTTGISNSAPNDPSPVINSTDGTNTTISELNCSSVISDPDGDALNVSIRWYNGGILNISVNFTSSFANGTLFNATLGSGNTTKGNVWNCSMVLTDNGELASNWTNSSELEILNTAPSAFSNIILNSTLGTNLTLQNLSLYFDTNSDSDEDAVFNITDWRTDDVSIAVLNAPFDRNESSLNGLAVPDYSTFGNNGTLQQIESLPVSNYPEWISNGVKGGAYYLSPNDDTMPYINFTHSDSLNIIKEITVEIWINKTRDFDYQAFVMKGSGAAEATAGHQNSFLLRAWDSGKVQFRILGAADADQSYSANTSGAVSLGEWHHIVGVYDRQNVSLYVDGVKTEGDAYNGDIRNSSVDIFVGRDSYFSNRMFNGSVDEFRIYNESLSEDQILANYQAGLDGHSPKIILSNETVKGNNWSAAIVPTDLEDDGNMVISDGLVILNTPPSVPSLDTPTTGNTTVINRTTLFDWGNSSDDDDDPLTYRIVVADDESLTSVVFNETSDSSGVDSDYIYQDQLDVDSVLYWRIEVTDGTDTVVSTVWNFTVSSYIDISLPTSKVDFGSMNVDESDNTTDNSPPPIEIMNGGNVLTDINISATDLFTSSGLGNESYQFRINESESDSYNTTDSLFDWTVMPTGMVTAIFGLDYTGVNDTAYCHINVTVPMSEPVGEPDSNITFTGFMSG